VEAGFGQIDKLQTADPGVDLTQENIDTCNNPTFVEGQPNTNYLATIAPLPPACDKTGTGPCAAGVTPNGIGSTPTSSGTYPGGTSSSRTSPRASVTGPSPGTASETSTGSTTSLPAGTPTAPANTGPTSSAVGTDPTLKPAFVSTSLPGYGISSLLPLSAPFAALLFLLLVFGLPAVIGYRRSRTRREVEQ
jgi:hypothetical protein